MSYPGYSSIFKNNDDDDSYHYDDDNENKDNKSDNSNNDKATSSKAGLTLSLDYHFALRLISPMEVW